MKFTIKYFHTKFTTSKRERGGPAHLTTPLSYSHGLVYLKSYFRCISYMFHSLGTKKFYRFKCLASFRLSESLLEISSSLVFCNSLSNLRKTVFISLFESNKFVSSENIERSRRSELKIPDIEKKKKDFLKLVPA